MTQDNNGHSNGSRPLDGIKIIEYGVFHAGPGANAILGDLGADVIKIEVAKGDPERYWATVGSISIAKPDGESIVFEVSNRNKRSLCLDINQPKGRDILHRLIKGADVFLTNLRKSTKAKMGIDYESLRPINERIIHANVSGYGPEGQMSDMGAFDPLGQARSGMMYATGTDDPVLISMGVLDQATAIAASHAIITALLARERQGIGQEVHVSLYSTAIWLQHMNFMISNAIKTDPTRPGVRASSSPLRNSFQCKDGKWVLGTHHPESRYWPRLCKLAGREELIDDPRFKDEAARKENSRELMIVFDEIFATKTRDEWMELFVEYGMLFSAVQKLEEVATDPQALANQYMVPFDIPGIGQVMIPGYPVHFSTYDAGTHSPAPRIGQHTNTVLKELGLSDEEIETLHKEQIIVQDEDSR